MNFDPVALGSGQFLRTMTESDLTEVMRIEGASFDSPWTKNNFLDEFKNDDISLPLVLVLEGDIIAFAVLWIVMDECHLANIAVLPDHRRKGLAKVMIREIIKLAKVKSCAKIMLEVRRSNTSALNLYKKFDFIQVGVRKNYYHDGFMNEEDAILMDLNLEQKNIQ